MKDQFELDPEKQRIEDEADQYRPVTGKERERLDRKRIWRRFGRRRKCEGSRTRRSSSRSFISTRRDQVWLLAEKDPGYLDDRIYRVAKRVYHEMSKG